MPASNVSSRKSMIPPPKIRTQIQFASNERPDVVAADGVGCAGHVPFPFCLQQSQPPQWL